METAEIRQQIFFKAPPEKVYQALMDSEKHARFTGDEAAIGAQVGDGYSAFGGYITGQNLELVPDRRIRQSWKAVEEDWPSDEYFSEVCFELREAPGGTIMEFTHSGVPAALAGTIRQGWNEYYWEPMRKMLEME